MKAGDTFGITDLKATKVNELTATFASAVDIADVTLAVTKDGVSQQHEIGWNDDKTIATITTTAKLKAGTYVVTATSASTKETSSKEVVVEDQHVASIEILNDVALTGDSTPNNNTNDHDYAYVYYQVLDQYGEDLTATTSIQWSSSCEVKYNRRDLGRLTLQRTDNKDFTYGEQVFVTGVYTKTGLMAQKVLTIGAEQALNTVEMVGFVKKNSSKIIQVLPVGFKSYEYYLLFDVRDQNNNTMEANPSYCTANSSSVTFISDNVLLVKEVVGEAAATASTMVVDGHEYNRVVVNPGDQADKGGEVNITAIANMTGTQVKKNYVVGDNHILTSFTMSSPTSLIADGETVVIPFTALDQDGDMITNFVTLADNLNALSFSASEGDLCLIQQNDGTAVLKYIDKTMAWTDPQAIDGVDRKVSLTAVVVAGGSNTLMLDISDKARPETIQDVDMASAILEHGTITIGLDKFTFQDQYGRTMSRSSYNTDNGFFATAKSGLGSGSRELGGYTFNIQAEYKGSNSAIASVRSTGGSVIEGEVVYYMLFTSSPIAINTSPITGSAITVDAFEGTNTAVTGNVLNFSIVKWETANYAPNKIEQVSSTKIKTFSIVDISQLRSFAASDLKTQYVNTTNSSKPTGEYVSVPGGLSASNAGGNTNMNANISNTKYAQVVTVTGLYNGIEVVVPTTYFTVSGDKISNSDTGDNRILEKGFNIAGVEGRLLNTVSQGAISWSDFYDVTTAKYLRHNTTDTLTIGIYPVSGGSITGTNPVDSIKKTITISDEAPHLASLDVLDTLVQSATKTTVSASTMKNQILTNQNNKPIAYDQYGVVMSEGTGAGEVSFTYKISDIKEASNGYTDNNFTVRSNDTLGAEISQGAELGDTFLLTITVTDNSCKVWLAKDVKVTVGADTNAYVSSTSYGNRYKNVLKHNYLEVQRRNLLNITTTHTPNPEP